MKFVILMLVLSLSISAQDKEGEELKKVMKSFVSAMELIQHGILYNNIDEMNKGSKMLRINDDKLLQSHGKALMKHMPDNPEFAKTYAKRTGEKIRNYADSLDEQIGSGTKSYSKISATYTHILHECVGCHQKVRNW
ncbi:MAG: hypothetical protein WBF77_00995 [Sulfurimonadaceae bacterium]